MYTIDEKPVVNLPR